jgi:hypothetical protein
MKTIVALTGLPKSGKSGFDVLQERPPKAAYALPMREVALSMPHTPTPNS